jgi:hypothetical protein
VRDQWKADECVVWCVRVQAFMYRKHADSGRSSFMVMDVGSDFRLQAVRREDTTTTTLLLLLLRG